MAVPVSGGAVNVPINNQAKGTAGIASSPWEEDIDIPETPKPSQQIIGSLDVNAKKVPTDTGTSFAVPNDLEEKVGQKIPAQNFIEPSGNANKQAALAQQATAPVQAAAIQPNAQVQQPQNNVGVRKNMDIAKPGTAVQAAGNVNQTGSGVVPSNVQKIPLHQPSVNAAVQTGDPETAFIANQIAGKTLNNAEPQAERLPKIKGRIRLPQISSFKSMPILIVAGVTSLFFVSILLTEMGMLSIGAEKVYGMLGIERLWGGLGKDPESALAISGLEMKRHANFKVSGSALLTVDKSVNSPITSPLVARNEYSSPFGDERVAAVFRAAVLAQSSLSSDTSSGSSSSLFDSSSSSSSASTSDTSSSSSDSLSGSSFLDSGSDSLDTTDATDTTDSTTTSSNDENATSDENQSDYPSYQFQGAKTKDVSANISASFNASSSKVDFTLKKVTGDAKVSVMQSGEKLFVQGDSSIDFGQGGSEDTWVQYPVASLKGKNPTSEIFSINQNSGFSVKGTRVGNEKVGTFRTYHYRLSNIEIGNYLSSIGITSDMVQSMTGDVWIGVRDKLMKKISLKITPAPSSAVTAMDITLLFGEYDKQNTIEEPDASVVTEPQTPTVTPTTTPTGTPTTTPTVSPTTTQTKTSDEQRKTDLQTISVALEQYKVALGSYPIASETIKLNTPGNILQAQLVPTYLRSLPVDSKASEGWYYAYKSNGSTFSLSARLESSSDPGAVMIANGVFLYYVYNR